MVRAPPSLSQSSPGCPQAPAVRLLVKSGLQTRGSFHVGRRSDTGSSLWINLPIAPPERQGVNQEPPKLVNIRQGKREQEKGGPSTRNHIWVEEGVGTPGDLPVLLSHRCCWRRPECAAEAWPGARGVRKGIRSPGTGAVDVGSFRLDAEN